MKKQLTALLTTALLITSLTGCKEGNNSSQDFPTNSDINNSSSENAGSSQNTSSDESSFKSETTSQATENVVRVQYKDAQIPDIHCETGDSQGRVSFWDKNSRIDGTLDGIVFETHTLGDYTINLIGDGVRTDLANFPDKIFAKDLYIEVSKDGTIIQDGTAHCCNAAFGVGETTPEKVLLNEKIGNYVDGYELERPVIALRYFFSENNEVKNFFEFFEIYNDESLWGDHVNKHAPNTGVVVDGSPVVKLNTQDGELCRLGTFSADEFTVIDSKTLEDGTAGVRYNFTFTNPPEMTLFYTTAV